MDKQERLARKWAEEELQRVAGDVGSTAAAEFILANTEPETMADVEWVHGEHHMAGADWDGAPVVMIDPGNGRSTIVLDIEEEKVYSADDKDLTPNGKRYELREVTEPARPVVLETVEAYDNAPDGTIVATDHGAPWLKELGDWWVDGGIVQAESIAYQPRMVLRWGWGV